MHLKKALAYIIGTVLGSGYFPKAPGTAGSLFAVLFYYFFISSGWVLLVLSFVLFFAGAASATFIEREKGKDAQLIVIDELVGQWIACLFLPKTMPVLAAAFLFFRLFDIFKPYPIDKLQNLAGGWGVMSDDALAGIYANVTIQLIIFSGVFTWIP